MTVENEMYGGNWQTCSSCGVKDRADQVVKVGDVFRHIEAKAATCAEWKATLARAKPADLTRVLQPDDQFLAEMHAVAALPPVTFRRFNEFVSKRNGKGSK